MELTKKYRLVWKGKKVVLIGSFDGGSVTGCKTGFDADTKSAIDNKIASKSLVLTDEQKKDWQKVE